jgi:hypothetical protein
VHTVAAAGSLVPGQGAMAGGRGPDGALWGEAVWPRIHPSCHLYLRELPVETEGHPDSGSDG